MRQLFLILLFPLILGCKPEPTEKPFNPFGNVYRIDSVAGQEGFAEPRYVILTKDSLFQAFGYWDYSFPYETQLRINDSLQVSNHMNEKYVIEPTGDKIWLNFPNGKRFRYSQGFANYDSAYKHLRMIKTQEALLLGTWRFMYERSEDRDGFKGKDLLRCRLDNSSILRFTRRNDHKIVQVESRVGNKIDTCLRRDFRMDGNAILIFEYDGFPPWTIIKLDAQQLVIQGPGDVLYFEKISE